VRGKYTDYLCGIYTDYLCGIYCPPAEKRVSKILYCKYTPLSVFYIIVSEVKLYAEPILITLLLYIFFNDIEMIVFFSALNNICLIIFNNVNMRTLIDVF
jgi:hypothetical protein